MHPPLHFPPPSPPPASPITTRTVEHRHARSDTAFVLRYATLASEHKVSSLDVAVGLTTALTHAPNAKRWLGLVAKVRKAFDGDLVATVPGYVACQLLLHAT